MHSLFLVCEAPPMAITDLIKGRDDEEIAENPEEEEDEVSHECKQLLLSLPRERGWRTTHLYFFQQFWCQTTEIQAILSFQTHFQASDSDIILASIPKSGTTWLKALAFAIVNRARFSVFSKKHPLFSANPHDLVHFIEYKVFSETRNPDLSAMAEPRIFGTHIPFHSLSSSVKKSNAKIVYICRNPFDTFVSSFLYVNKIKSPLIPALCLEEAFEMFCNGVVGYGPFYNHMLGYWKASLEKPEKVLFLKYEDMKEAIVVQIKKLADFLGFPFSAGEERDGVVEKIAKLCSIGSLKKMEVNKNGRSIKNFQNKDLFRKGEVGDWVNYFTPRMAERLSAVMEDKLGISGLTFKVFV